MENFFSLSFSKTLHISRKIWSNQSNPAKKRRYNNFTLIIHKINFDIILIASKIVCIQVGFFQINIIIWNIRLIFTFCHYMEIYLVRGNAKKFAFKAFLAIFFSLFCSLVITSSWTLQYVLFFFNKYKPVCVCVSNEIAEIDIANWTLKYMYICVKDMTIAQLGMKYKNIKELWCPLNKSFMLYRCVCVVGCWYIHQATVLLLCVCCLLYTIFGISSLFAFRWIFICGGFYMYHFIASVRLFKQRAEHKLAP